MVAMMIDWIFGDSYKKNLGKLKEKFKIDKKNQGD